VLDEARAVPEELLPELPVRVEEPPGLSTVANLLAAALAQCCAQSQVAGSLVANVADLKSLIRWHLEGSDAARCPALLRGWRAELCGSLLLDVLEGRVALRVADPGNEFPVALEPVKGTDSMALRESERRPQ
jgi:ribonuclease D